jgi:hypothetical protein
VQVKLSEFVGLRFLLLYSGWDGFSFLCTLGDCCLGSSGQESNHVVSQHQSEFGWT